MGMSLQVTWPGKVAPIASPSWCRPWPWALLVPKCSEPPSPPLGEDRPPGVPSSLLSLCISPAHCRGVCPGSAHVPSTGMGAPWEASPALGLICCFPVCRARCRRVRSAKLGKEGSWRVWSSLPNAWRDRWEGQLPLGWACPITLALSWREAATPIPTLLPTVGDTHMRAIDWHFPSSPLWQRSESP